MKNLFLLSIISAFIFSCSDSKNGENLPPAAGLAGDMYLVMDSAQWKGPLGVLIDSIFKTEVKGLPRPETDYNLVWIDARKLNMVLKQRRNIIFAVSLDQNSRGALTLKKLFTPESIEKIKAEPDFFMKTSPHVFARGQEVMYLVGRTEKELIANIQKGRKKVIGHFDRTERERLTAHLFKAGQVKGISEWLQTNLKCDIKIPFGYRLADHNQEFLWVRQINPKDDKDIFIARKPYTSMDDFKKENLIAYRNQICSKYLFGDPEESDSYLITETSIPFIPVEVDTVNFNNHFAIEMRGLWKTNSATMGGPFVSYAFVDEAAGQFYYIEGFLFSPAKEQRPMMREIETILYTFKTSNELKSSEQKK